MLEFIEGTVEGLNPSYVIINNNNSGIGYFINISLVTYTAIHNKPKIRLLVHQVIREDAHILYGFFSKGEREIFRSLISVSGVGANTARMILSSMPPAEVQNAILSENVAVLKGIKGIGAKTAQRIIVDLKDKIGKESQVSGEIFTGKDNTIKEEALSALVNLGFTKSSVEKVVSKVLIQQPDSNLEEIIKVALKNL